MRNKEVSTSAILSLWEHHQGERKVGIKCLRTCENGNHCGRDGLELKKFLNQLFAIINCLFGGEG
jgi:hypothetical protein